MNADQNLQGPSAPALHVRPVPDILTAYIAFTVKSIRFSGFQLNGWVLTDGNDRRTIPAVRSLDDFGESSMFGKFGSLLSPQGDSISRKSAQESVRGARQTKGKRRQPKAGSWVAGIRAEQLECRAMLAGPGTGIDINVSNVLNTQYESAIAVNPTNPQNLAVVASGGDSTDDQLFLAYSFNGGQTWVHASLTDTTDQVSGFFETRFNGSLAFDSFGNLHLVYLAQLLVPNTVVYGVSTTGGASFTTRQLTAGNQFIDTPRLAVGPAGPNTTNEAVVVTYKNANGDLVATGAAVSGLGSVANFSAPTTFYRSTFTQEGGFPSPAIGANGEISIAWQDPDFGSGAVEVWFTSDNDGLTGGLNFPNARPIFNSNAGATDSIPATPFRGSYASPRLVYDLSNRATRGRLYLVYEDKSSIFSDDVNVFVRASSNNGTNFGLPVRINDDSGANSQFYADVSVDPVTAALFVSWYDARNDAGGGTGIDSDGFINTDVEVYSSFSTDGAQTWAPNVKISDGATNWRNDLPQNLGLDLGRYIGVTSYGGVGYTAWADNSNSTGDNGTGEMDIYFDGYQYDQPPTIAFVPDITLSPVLIDEDTSTGALTFVIGDDISLPDDLKTTGFSSNQSIVPNAGINFSGTGLNRTVTVTPLANRSGKVTITVQVTDGAGLTSSESFDLTILPTPDPLPVPDDTTPVATVVTDTTSTPIADNATTTSAAITISGLDSYLYDANVTINISHSANGELDVVLISPSGTRVKLTTGNGGNFADVFAGTTFDDQIITTPVTDFEFTDLIAAKYLVPEGALGQLLGEDPNGDWTLEITDSAAGATGTLNSWSLELTTLTSPPQLQAFSGIYTTPAATAIPDDGTPLLLPLVFNGLDPFTWDVDVQVNVNHPNSNDLDISLISPLGTEVLLTSGNGGSNSDVFRNSGFSDQALSGTAVTDASFSDATPIGIVIPEAALSGFVGENPNGTWTLKIVDHSSGQVGSVLDWGLNITTIFLNDPPTIGTIFNGGAIPEDSGPVTVQLNTISAGGGETQPLRVTATSSDPSLVPDPVVNYTSPLNSGTLTYQPLPNASGTAIITVRVEDGGFDQNLATTDDNEVTLKTFLVVVNSVNDAPTIDPVVGSDVITDLGQIDEDFGLLDVPLTGISSGGGENQVLQVTATSSQLALVASPIVDYVQGASTATMHVHSNADVNGLVILTVTVMDGGLDNDLATATDNLSVTRKFSLFIRSVNDAPTISPINNPAPVNEDAPQQSLVLSNISPGGQEVQPLRLTATSSDLGVISDVHIDFTPGSSTAPLHFRPAQNGFGTATITVTVEDGGEDADLNTPLDNLITVRTFDVTVIQTNDPPVFATLGETLVLDEDAPQQVIQLTGVSAGPQESQDLIFTVSSSNTGLVSTPVIDYTSPNDVGTLTFDITPTLSGSSTITLTLMDAGLDGDLSTTEDNQVFTRMLVVIVRDVNDPPTIDAINDPAPLNEGDGEQTIQLTGISAGSTEVQPIKIEAFSDAPSIIPSPLVNYVSGATDGLLTFAPIDNQYGTATITVRVTDGGADNNLATVNDNGITTRTFTVQVNPINDPPSFNFISDPAAIDESGTPTTQIINITGIVAGPNETQLLQFSVENGDATKITDPVIDYLDGSATATLSYTPKPGQFGVVPITVTVTDPGEDGDPLTPADNLSYTQVFQVRINAFNDPPTLDAIPNPAAVNEDAGPQTVALSGVTAGVGEAGQPLLVTAVSSDPALVSGFATHVNGSGIPDSLTYQLSANRSGTAVITVTLTDGGLDNSLGTPGDNKSISRQFTVTVNPVNDVPSLNILDSASNMLNGNYNINEDSGLQTLTLANVMAGPFENQPIKITATVDAGSLNLITSPVVSYTSPNTQGTLKFTPLADKSGTAVVHLRVEDGGTDGNLATTVDNLFVTYDLNINIADVNDSPTLNPISDPNPLSEDAPTQSLGLSGIGAGGNESQTLLIEAFSDNPGLIPDPSVVYTTGSSTGSLIFTPVANQSGVAHIVVTVDDQHGGFVQQFFTVVVTPVNDAPTINSLGSTLTIDEDSGEQTINLSGISGGPGEAGQLIQVSVTSSRPDIIPQPDLIYTPQDPTGQIVFQPLPDANGTVTLTVKVTDGGADGNLNTVHDNISSTATLTVVVTPTPETPELTGDSGTAVSKGGHAVPVFPGATLADPDSPNFKHGGILVEITDGNRTGDKLTVKRFGQGSDRITFRPEDNPPRPHSRSAAAPELLLPDQSN